jgi:hypothetical protein
MLNNGVFQILGTGEHFIFEPIGPAFLAVSAILAIIGVSIAVQTWARSGKVSWRDVGRGYAEASWMVPVVGIVAIYAWWVRPELFSAPTGVQSSTVVVQATDVATTVEKRAVLTHAVPAEPLALAATSDPSPTPSPPKAVSPNASPAAVNPPKGSSTAVPKAAPPASPKPAAAAAPVPAPPATPPAPPEQKLPDWASKEVVEDGNSRLVVVRTEVWATPEVAEERALAAATDLVADGLGKYYPEARDWLPPENLVRSEAVRNVYIEPENHKTTTSGTPFRVYRAYYQVELSPKVWASLIPVWKEAVVGRRLWALGGFAGLLTLTFATLAAYFRLDERSAGRYRGRLKLAAVSIIAAGGVAAATLL